MGVLKDCDEAIYNDEVPLPEPSLCIIKKGRKMLRKKVGCRDEEEWENRSKKGRSKKRDDDNRAKAKSPQNKIR